MARLHEYQGKALLAERGLPSPRGLIARSGDEANRIAEQLGGRCVVKAQAWTTGRAGMGGVSFAETPAEAGRHASRMLQMRVGAFPIEMVLVEEALSIRDELFVSLSIDDAMRQPVLLLSLAGGSGVEDRAADVHRLPINVATGIDAGALADLLVASTLDASLHEPITRAIDAIVRLAHEVEARSVEVNPLATTTDGRVFAADCRMTIDDYAVFRHPELGVDIARELDHPPTQLERIAYDIEQADHRGTFYFARLPVADEMQSRKIGFHGAGGGGSMMSMDAVSQAGFSPANFTDTSGNPSASKVYAAARVILAQEGLVGYFGSGSGVASQEQHHSAYGLAKAFLEMNLSIPALIRLGGNSEDRAVEILQGACADLPAVVEAYKKDDTPAFCAQRFGDLVKASDSPPWIAPPRRVPAFVGRSYSFPIEFAASAAAAVWIDQDACTPEATDLIVSRSEGVLKNDNGKPALALDQEEAAKKDSEMIACEIECRLAGFPFVFVDLPVPGLDDEPDAAAHNGARG